MGYDPIGLDSDPMPYLAMVALVAEAMGVEFLTALAIVEAQANSRRRA